MPTILAYARIVGMYNNERKEDYLFNKLHPKSHSIVRAVIIVTSTRSHFRICENVSECIRV